LQEKNNKKNTLFLKKSTSENILAETMQTIEVRKQIGKASSCVYETIMPYDKVFGYMV
jgi:hypothetical protein